MRLIRYQAVTGDFLFIIRKDHPAVCGGDPGDDKTKNVKKFC